MLLVNTKLYLTLLLCSSLFLSGCGSSEPDAQDEIAENINNGGDGGNNGGDDDGGDNGGDNGGDDGGDNGGDGGDNINVKLGCMAMFGVNCDTSNGTPQLTLYNQDLTVKSSLSMTFEETKAIAQADSFSITFPPYEVFGGKFDPQTFHQQATVINAPAGDYNLTERAMFNLLPSNEECKSVTLNVDNIMAGDALHLSQFERVKEFEVITNSTTSSTIHLDICDTDSVFVFTQDTSGTKTSSAVVDLTSVPTNTALSVNLNPISWVTVMTDLEGDVLGQTSQKTSLYSLWSEVFFSSDENGVTNVAIDENAGNQILAYGDYKVQGSPEIGLMSYSQVAFATYPQGLTEAQLVELNRVDASIESVTLDMDTRFVSLDITGEKRPHTVELVLNYGSDTEHAYSYFYYVSGDLTSFTLPEFPHSDEYLNSYIVNALYEDEREMLYSVKDVESVMTESISHQLNYTFSNP